MRRRRNSRSALITAVAALAAATATPQAPGRIATSAEALVASPVFFHGRQITVRRELVEARGLTELASTSKPIFVFWRDAPTTTRDGEVRGEFWDLGRLRPDDSRFSSQNFGPVLEAASRGEWPARDQVFVILGATFVESPLPQQPSIRALALAPEKYADRGVTIAGRFRGRNLFGDLPLPAGKSRWDFVLQAADGAVWITGLRPRGKGFDLDVEARVDTGRWLEVTGTVRRDGSLVWVEASSIALASAPTETPVEVTVPTVPREAPPQVVFTAPVANDTDVEVAALVGGTLAASTHLTKASTRAVANTSPEPFSNWFLSFIEDAFVIGLGALALKYPAAAAVVVLVCLVLIVAFASWIIRAVRRWLVQRTAAP